MKTSLMILLSLLLGSVAAEAEGLQVHSTKLKCALLPKMQERIISIPTYPTYGLEFLGQVNGVMARFSIDEDNQLNVEISEFGKKVASTKAPANRSFQLKAQTADGQVEAKCSPVTDEQARLTSNSGI